MTGCAPNCRLTAISLMLAGFTAFLCGFFMHPAHACCGESADAMASMACCKATDSQTALATGDKLPDLKHSAAPPAIPVLKSSFVSQPVHTGVLAHTYTPDQSRRYLALRVLRN